MQDGADLVQVDLHDALGELGYEGVATVEIFALPTPTEAWKHVKCKPDILQGGMSWEDIAFRHMPIEDNHGRDVEGDGRGEKGNIREANKLVVHYDRVVRSDDG